MLRNTVSDMTAHVFICCLALFFTIGSFYWLQARKGRLKLYPVVTFSGYRNKSRLVLRLPVILFNSGACPRVITALRLVTTDDTGTKIVRGCHSLRKTIDHRPRHGGHGTRLCKTCPTSRG